MSGRFIDQFEVILLDQGQTFMFDNDRFGAEVDYFSTYRQIGGKHLSRERLDVIMKNLVAHLFTLARDPACYDSFPTISQALRNFPDPLDLSDKDILKLEQLVALQEVGTISIKHAAVLQRLSRTHRLGIISNIWGCKQPFERNLEAAGVFECFEHIIWSSDHSCIKPSARLFRHALQLFQTEPDRILFVGDHPWRDIDAAKTLGCSAAWIRNGEAVYPEGARNPDRTVADLVELEQA
jgi:HAD superfamily hydrolase (TIGR01549 family)